MKRTSLLLGPVGLTSVLFLPALAQAAVLTVGSGADFSTIQAAINASQPGDEILVAKGTWLECLTVGAGKDVRLYGLAGRVETTIQCGGGATRAIVVEDGASLGIAEFTIKNSGKYGISVNSSEFQAFGLVFTSGGANNPLDGGAAITLADSDAWLSDVSITGVTSTVNGGAVAVTGVSEVTLVGGSIKASASSANGGALFVGPGSSVTVLGTLMEGNDATVDGGAIYVAEDAELKLRNAILKGNQATHGGAIANDGYVSVEASELDENSADEDGGALWINLGYADLYSNTITSNTAKVGGAVFNSIDGGLYVAGNLFETNTASPVNPEKRGGGAIYSDSYFTSRSNEYLSQTAQQLGVGGAINVNGAFNSQGDSFAGNSAQFGGAIHAKAVDFGSLQVQGGRFTQNVGRTSSGALYIANTTGGSTSASVQNSEFDQNSAEIFGGAMMVEGLVNLYVGQSVFTGNSTRFSSGGAIQMETTSFLDGYGLYFSENIAKQGQGGAIFYNGSSIGEPGISLSQSIFDGNTAVPTTPNSGGGAVAVKFGKVNIQNSRFVDNISDGVSGDGGAVFTNNGDEFMIRESVFEGNTAGNRGGALMMYRPVGGRTVEGVVFAENTSGADAPAAIGKTDAMGGAVFEGQVSSDVSRVTESYWRNLVLVGNQSSPTGHDGLTLEYINAAQTPTTQYIYDSVFAANDEYGLTASNATSNQVYNSNLFWGHASSAVLNTADYTAQYDNVIVDGGTALFTAWSADGDLANDDLALLETTVAFGSNGTGVEAFGIYDDQDEDGISAIQGDCDDNDDETYPGALEVPANYNDDDCVLGDDRDTDDDGYWDQTFYGADCRSEDATAFPRATEVWYDGSDSNCDGLDDGDQDGDLYVFTSVGGSDCDDTDLLIHPDALDVPYDLIDRDCDGNTADADKDGFEASDVGGPDCDDTDPLIRPDAAEVYYDGVDQNCDELSDNDQDGDGADAKSKGGTDCNDLDSAISPTATEIWYDGVDQNCDGANDFDQDGDGEPYITDCNDADATVKPGVAEVPDGKDNDCDGKADPDTDGDGVIDYYENDHSTDPNEVDSDDDGIDDGDEWGAAFSAAPRDSDLDTTPDVLDTDSDNDGLSDEAEAGLDSDRDGNPDYIDDDDDNDGVKTKDELEAGVPKDTDGDGIADHLDRDGDNDGVVDSLDSAPNDAGGDGAGDEAPGKPTKYGLGACDSTNGNPLGLSGLVALGALLLRRRRS